MYQILPNGQYVTGMIAVSVAQCLSVYHGLPTTFSLLIHRYGFLRDSPDYWQSHVSQVKWSHSTTDQLCVCFLLGLGRSVVRYYFQIPISTWWYLHLGRRLGVYMEKPFFLGLFFAFCFYILVIVPCFNFLSSKIQNSSSQRSQIRLLKIIE